MKKIIAFILVFSSTFIIAQTQKADDLIGTYMTDKNEGMVEITKRDNKYFGKLLWTKTEGKLDTNNPDVKQQSQPLRGKEILKSFDFNGSDLWHNGTIYDPKNGKTYSCKITRDEKGNLSVRGFIGVSLLGRTTLWIKVK
jgi:uncharacterized protein (DUF2147 family)